MSLQSMTLPCQEHKAQNKDIIPKYPGAFEETPKYFSKKKPIHVFNKKKIKFLSYTFFFFTKTESVPVLDMIETVTDERVLAFSQSVQFRKKLNW